MYIHKHTDAHTHPHPQPPTLKVLPLPAPPMLEYVCLRREKGPLCSAPPFFCVMGQHRGMLVVLMCKVRQNYVNMCRVSQNHNSNQFTVYSHDYYLCTMLLGGKYEMYRSIS